MPSRECLLLMGAWTLALAAAACGDTTPGPGRPSGSAGSGAVGQAGARMSLGGSSGLRGGGVGGEVARAGETSRGGETSIGAAGSIAGSAGTNVGGAGGGGREGMAGFGGLGRGGSAGAAGRGRGGAGGVSSSGTGGLGGTTSAAGGAGGRPTVTAAQGTKLVKVNASVHHQTFEGFGTSLCWWANHAGAWDTAGRNAVVDAVVDPVNGLGYNVFRYNIGGGDDPAHHHLDQYKDMPGFEPSKGTWDFKADANQRAVVQGILERGTGVILEAFSNSPPYWMTKSGCASGNTDGSNNLKDDSYDVFADYLTEVVKHYRDDYGITFRTLEPLNEPSADWWKANGGQEGCHVSASNQATLIKAVGTALTAKGLSDTKVSASDENSIDDGYNNMRGFDATTLAAMGQMNVHTYAGSKRAELRALATSKAKRLWQSESGPLNQTLADEAAAALFMAGRIISDLRDLQAEAWVDWQAGDTDRNWASFMLSDAKQTLSPLKRFYMQAGFSRYIRPGAVFVDIDNSDMVAAMSADGHLLAIVARNGDTSASRGFTFDLTSLPSVGAMAEAHRTSRSEDLASLPALAIDGYSFVATLPASSITTFVVTMP